MASASIATAFLSLACAAWTLLSDLAVVAYSPMVRLVGVTCVLVTAILIASSVRRESSRPGAGPKWWGGKPGRLCLFLAMIVLSVTAMHVLRTYRVNLDVVSHTAGVVAAVSLLTVTILRRRRPVHAA